MSEAIDDKILYDAIGLWGTDSQEQIAIGEIGEFLSLYGKKAQGRGSKSDWIDEIADVTIVIRQIALMYGPDSVRREIYRKMERLAKRISKHKRILQEADNG